MQWKLKSSKKRDYEVVTAIGSKIEEQKRSKRLFLVL